MADPVLLLLLAHADSLARLSEWPPAANLVEDTVTAAQGHGGGLSGRDARRLSKWAARWSRIHPQLRTWYERHSGHPDVGAALWAILDGYPAPQGARYGRLVQLWEADHGDRPAFPLIPRF